MLRARTVILQCLYSNNEVVKYKLQTMIMAQSGLTFVSLLLLSIVAVDKATTRTNQVLY